MPPNPSSRRQVRAIFLSDFHIGYKGFDAAAALDFLQSHACDYLYLVGDIFDGWKLEKRWYWNQSCTALIDEIVKMQKGGCKIFYTPGNHDEKLYDFLPFISRPVFHLMFGVRIDSHFTHKTADDKRFLVIHGHQWDSHIIRKTSKPSDRLHGVFMRIKDRLTELAILPPEKEVTTEYGRIRRFSLGKAIAKNGKGLLHRYTQAAVIRATKDRFDGVIYGHSHVPFCDMHDGVLIANCGSWTSQDPNSKSHTAIIEHADGTMAMTYWPMMRETGEITETIYPADIQCRFKETRQIIKLVHELWRNNGHKAYDKAVA